MPRLEIRSATPDAEGVRLFELGAPDGGELPAFEAGAHVALTLPGERVRQYSLLGDPADRRRYLIAVAREPNGRGGSAWLHDQAEVGQTLEVSAPFNHFRLVEDAPHSVLIAGGIGVTPLWSMIQRLDALGRSWELHYGARDRRAAALLDRMAENPRVRLHFSREPGGGRADLAAIVEAAPAGAHFYCCGPARMLEAFGAATRHLDPAHAHVEHFAPVEAAAVAGGFSVVLARSGRVLEIQPGQTILAALKTAGVRANYSCSEGVCGQCETKVLEGLPDHRDAILTDAERAANSTMMICCSGSKSDRLVLDL